MTTAYIALGSNVGDRLASLRKAVALLDGVVRTSSVYETEPVGPPQDDFLNAVAEIETSLSPRALLDRLKEIERDVGRVSREQRWGPREIDLDLLLYGDETVDEPGLQVPHPGLARRAFVLVPLTEIAPHVVPDSDVDTSGVRRTNDLLL